jgi:pimeloyl-ACP methyl ester carboxylesterase
MAQPHRTDTRRLDVLASGLMFDVDVAGEPGSAPVLLLHGFPQTSHTWRHELPALAAEGYFAIAPNQRGYSPHARPKCVEDYAVNHLVGDALGIAKSLGASRFHLVGHDWGGQLAWIVAARYPEQVETLTVLSRPHPAAFAAAMKSDPAQADRSKHHRAFQDASTVKRLLEDGAKRLRRTLAEQGVPPADVDTYLERLGNEAAMEAAVNWYRAGATPGASSLAVDVPPVAVPTLYLWGDADATVGRAAAEGTSRYVTGAYRFVEVPGAGHFLTDQAGEVVTRELLSHLNSVAM